MSLQSIVNQIIVSKNKIIFSCKNCGATSPKWMGKCNSCNEWNTFIEESIAQPTQQETKSASWSNDERRISVPTLIKDIPDIETYRINTSDSELNRVLGGGMVPGSLVLVGGEPGIGKSTLMLQVSLNMPLKVLYVSGEESEEQISRRAKRVGYKNKECFIYSETNVVSILKQAQKIQPQLIIIDSIQTLASPFIDSTPGNITQIRECTSELQRYAKSTNTPIVIIGHITKEGSIAGPKLLEHIVDVVLQFEGDQHYAYRILRTHKNRFGSTDEIGIYEMLATGLREVQNPSELFLSQSEEILSGNAVAAKIDGLRPMLIETQALVSTAIYGTPQRSATGFDLRRLSMLLAVLEKRCGLPFGQNDVFLNMAGGIKVDDPAIDLAIVSALISSLDDIPISKKVCFAGEIGLSGEVRAVSRIEQRIQEANRLGFEEIYISKYNAKGLKLQQIDIEVKTLATLEQLMSAVFS